MAAREVDEASGEARKERMWKSSSEVRVSSIAAGDQRAARCGGETRAETDEEEGKVEKGWAGVAEGRDGR